MKIILASASPRRKKMLQALGLNFEIIPSNYDEELTDNTFTYEKIEKLAYNKALDVVKNNVLEAESLIISADTVVVFDNQILGKPKSEKEAFKMLKKLSAKKHCVVTSICAVTILTKENKIISTTSFVEFNKLTDEMITEYIKEFKPFDKAGSYGIQELPDSFIKSIEGSFENIVGLCPLALKTLLDKFNFMV